MLIGKQPGQPLGAAMYSFFYLAGYDLLIILTKDTYIQKFYL